MLSLRAQANVGCGNGKATKKAGTVPADMNLSFSIAHARLVPCGRSVGCWHSTPPIRVRPRCPYCYPPCCAPKGPSRFYTCSACEIMLLFVSPETDDTRFPGDIGLCREMSVHDLQMARVTFTGRICGMQGLCSERFRDTGRLVSVMASVVEDVGPGCYSCGSRSLSVVVMPPRRGREDTFDISNNDQKEQRVIWSNTQYF